MSVLPTFFLMTPEDVERIPASAFPLAVRPDRAGEVEPGFKVMLAGSAAALRDLVRGCHGLASPLIAQPFQRVPNLIVHGVRNVNGEVIASRCYHVARKFQGVSLSLEPRPFPAQVERQCVRFAELAGLTGCYHLEFLAAPQEHAYFLEVNVRLGGTTDKVMKAGFDEPALLLQSYGLSPSTAVRIKDRRGRVVTKRFVLKHAIYAGAGRLTALDYPEVGRLRHLAYACRDLLLARESTFDWRDISGSVRFKLRGLTGQD
jgi:hypothetical protein